MDIQCIVVDCLCKEGANFLCMSAAIIIFVLTVITYIVAILEFRKHYRNSKKYGKLSKFHVFLVKIAIRLLPGFLRKKIQRFPEDDVDIQIKKLSRSQQRDQINALKHLEQILKYIPATSNSEQDLEKIYKIQRAILRLLWHTKTDSEVVKKAISMLCRYSILWPECSVEN